MDPFIGLEAFVATAEDGSFRAGATRLGLTPAAVSKAVLRLESDLGLRLFDRTTRKVALTREGEIYLSHCQRALAEMRAGRERVEQAHRLCVGELVVALSSILGAFVGSRLQSFSELYPGLSVRLVFGDRPSRLVDEQSDVALRIGKLVESRDVAVKLRDLKWATVAAPDYVQKRGQPSDPKDLVHHQCLGYRGTTGNDVAWPFLVGPDGRENQMYDGPKRLMTNDGRVLIDAARGGMGIAQVFYELVSEDLKKGRLVLLLPDYAAPGPPVHALCKAGQQATPKIRAFLDFVRREFRSID